MRTHLMILAWFRVQLNDLGPNHHKFRVVTSEKGQFAIYSELSSLQSGFFPQFSNLSEAKISPWKNLHGMFPLRITRFIGSSRQINPTKNSFESTEIPGIPNFFSIFFSSFLLKLVQKLYWFESRLVYIWRVCVRMFECQNETRNKVYFLFEIDGAYDVNVYKNSVAMALRCDWNAMKMYAGDAVTLPSQTRAKQRQIDVSDFTLCNAISHRENVYHLRWFFRLIQA